MYVCMALVRPTNTSSAARRRPSTFSESQHFLSSPYFLSIQRETSFYEQRRKKQQLATKKPFNSDLCVLYCAKLLMIAMMIMLLFSALIQP